MKKAVPILLKLVERAITERAVAVPLWPSQNKAAPQAKAGQ